MLGARHLSRVIWQRALRLWPIGVLLGASALVWLTGPAQPARGAQRPIQVHDQHYVSSNECRSCHPSEYASWADTYHRRMTQLAQPQNVLGRFDGVSLGEAPRFSLGRSADDYYVDIVDGAAAQPSAAGPERHPITLITGSHHMQLYWYATGEDRRLTQLPYVYLNADQRWVPRSAIFIEPPQTAHPPAQGRWNTSCIVCHTTLGQPRVDAKGSFDTQVAELGIACEACHGPGEQHVARYRSPLARYRRHITGDQTDRDDAIVQPDELTHERASYVCAQCHSTWMFNGPTAIRAWNRQGPAFRPGSDDLGSGWLVQPSRAAVDARIAGFIAYDPTRIASQFWSDGEVRVSGREFNGLVDSPCYARGELRCTSCHTMHQHADDPRPSALWRVNQLAAGMDGDVACLECHDSYARAPQEHTRHPAGSEGSRCYNCHMPYTSYGLLRAQRSHRITIPSVQATLDAGRPNACNLCHLDKSLAWTASQLRERYGVNASAVTGELANHSAALVLGVRGDAGQRALIAWALGWGPARAASEPSFTPALLGVLLDDPYTAVRYIAARSLQSLGVSPDTLSYDYLQPPNARPSVREPLQQRMAAELPDQQRAEQRALVERLLRERDNRPVQLLE